MTIPELRLAANQLKTTADRVILYKQKHSLDEAWTELTRLYGLAPGILVSGRVSKEGLSLKGKRKNWKNVQLMADNLVIGCDREQPPASDELSELF
jgi:hypothetical protein